MQALLLIGFFKIPKLKAKYFLDPKKYLMGRSGIYITSLENVFIYKREVS